MPIRTVLLTQLCKYGGEKNTVLSARDFHQISGRAGRKGFDSTGWVVAQAPEHAIENLQLERKQADTGKKFVKRKAPEKNYSHWDKQTFEKLISASPERLVSRFQIGHGMLLNVLSRNTDGAAAMRSLIKDSHEAPKSKKALTRRAWQLFRALLERQIVEIIPRTDSGARVRVNVELQDEFSMNQTLSLYLLDTLKLLDPADPSYPLSVLTLVESILENPEPILRKQLDKIKSEAMAEMKSQGLEFDQRIEELEKLEHPKPLREFIYTTFNVFAAAHPWVGQENIRPKSIAREMFEEFRSFSDYVKIYELQRVEGLLLRHLASVHKVLAQTVPDLAKTDALLEMELYLGTLVREVDSSLLEQWERLRNPSFKSEGTTESKPPGAEAAEADITRDVKRFRNLVRNRIFQFLRALASNELTAALALLSHTAPAEDSLWTEPALEAALAPFYAAHSRLRLDPEARNAKHTRFENDSETGVLHIFQRLVDPEDLNEWVAVFSVDVVASRELGTPQIQLVKIEFD